MIDYQAYMGSEEWRKRADRVLIFWKNACAICSTTKCLHVHHRTYERLGDELLTDLLPLCENCHKLFHEKLGRSMKTQSIDEFLS